MSAARGIGRGRKRKGGQRRGEDWRPKTRLGRLVQSGKINSLEEIFKFSIAIKEP
jgi:small subunit ribosomal protein S2e